MFVSLILKTESMLLNIVSPFSPKRNMNQNEMKIKSLNYFFSLPLSPVRQTRGVAL
jgi:hypothetical protein